MSKGKGVQKFNKGKRLAFKMKFEGFTYEEIGATEGVGYTANSLEVYFAKNGHWYQEYRDWADAKIAEIEEEIKDNFVSKSKAAFRQINNMAFPDANNPTAKRDPVQLKAAQDILDRSGFAAVRKVEVDAPSEDIADRLMRGVEERRKKRLAAKPKKQGKLKNDTDR